MTHPTAEGGQETEPPTSAPPLAAEEAVDRDDANNAPPASLWDRMQDDPQYAPEHLALEAVRRLGPEADKWVDPRPRRATRAHAGRPRRQVAQKKFVNLTRASPARSPAPPGCPARWSTSACSPGPRPGWSCTSRPSYGVDPRHPDRATDLLVLQRVHKYAETAPAGARRRRRARERRARCSPAWATASGGQGACCKLGVRLAQMAGVRAAKRMFAKIVPGAAIILGTWANSSATKDLAQRIPGALRPRSSRPGTSAGT